MDSARIADSNEFNKKLRLIMVMDIEVKHFDDFNGMLDHTAEGFITELAEDVGYGLMGAVKWLKHLATFDLGKYYDGKLSTNLKRELLLASRRLDRANELDFEKILDIELHVSHGISGNQKPLVTYLSSNMLPAIAKGTTLLADFNIMLGNIISSEEERNRVNVLADFKSKYRDVIVAQTEADMEISNMLSDSAVTTVAGLTHNIEVARENITNLRTIGRTVDEQDLKTILSSVRSVKQRLDVIVDMVKENTISKDVSNDLSDITLAHANSVTLMAKLYHIYYEVMQNHIRIVEEL